MSRAVVAVIVEGHGEQQSAARTILSRAWSELLRGEYLHVLAPIRIPRQKLVQPAELLKAISLAELKLADVGGYDRKFVVVLLDADKDAPCVLGPKLQDIVATESSHVDVSVVVANVEWETWFVGAARSLTEYFDLTVAQISSDPESARHGKGLVAHLMGGRYAETVDQPRLTAAMDLALCRQHCPSFDKLCRELAKRID